jgi:hypothetical protein
VALIYVSYPFLQFIQLIQNFILKTCFTIFALLILEPFVSLYAEEVPLPEPKEGEVAIQEKKIQAKKIEGETIWLEKQMTPATRWAEDLVKPLTAWMERKIQDRDESPAIKKGKPRWSFPWRLVWPLGCRLQPCWSFS